MALTASAAHCVRLRRRRRQWLVVAWSCEPLPPGGVEADIAAAVRRALGRLPGRGLDVAMGIPSAQVIRHGLRVNPHWDEPRLEVHCHAQAAKLFPYPAEQMALDYQCDGDRLGLRICRRETLERLRRIAAGAGLRLRRLEPADEARRRGEALIAERRLRPAPEMDRQDWRHRQADFAEACALAAGGGFNLLPWRGWHLRAANRRFAQIAALALLLAQAPALTLTYYWKSKQILWDQARQQAQLRIAQRSQRMRSIEQARSERSAREHDAARRRRWSQKRQRVAQVLMEWRSLSEFLSWRRLRIDNEHLHMDGTAANIEGIERLLARLRRGSIIDNPRLISIRARDDGGGQDFSLSGNLAKSDTGARL